MAISIKNLAQAIYDSSQDKSGADLNSIIERSAELIKEKNLLSKKEEILKALENIINKKNKIVKARISSKDKLHKELQEDIETFIKKKYKANEVILELKEDPKLLGGIKIEVGDDIIDTTLSNKINQLQNYLITH